MCLRNCRIIGVCRVTHGSEVTSRVYSATEKSSGCFTFGIGLLILKNCTLRKWITGLASSVEERALRKPPSYSLLNEIPGATVPFMTFLRLVRSESCIPT